MLRIKGRGQEQEVAFNSWAFLGLLLITFTLFHTVLRNQPWGRRLLLLAASYTFYGWWDWRFLGLILLSTVIDYVCARMIWAQREDGKDRKAGKPWLIVSIASNLIILGFFKYFNFFLDSAEVVLGAFGLKSNWLDLTIVLPVGISFYTFQSMAYSIDVYRNTAKVCKSFVTFATYVAFFPQLVAGPIERAAHLIPQLENPRQITWSIVQSGLMLMLLGFFKKLVIADPIGTFVMETTQDPSAYTTSRLLLTTYLFMFQIYADFSGYSDIARGTARLFGVDLIRNFEQPLFSANMTELWRRWHISLSRWFFDYLYLWLSRHVAPGHMYLCLFLVMAISGLWHGAGWNFVIWGCFHGLMLCIEQSINRDRRKRGIKPKPMGPIKLRLRILAQYHLLTYTTVFFFTPDMERIAAYLYNVVTKWMYWFPEDTETLKWTLAIAAITYFIDKMQEKTGIHEFPLVMRPLYGGLVIGAMILAVIYWSDFPGDAFIYFQF